MRNLTHKFRIKKGDMEFEVEGSVAFVEKKLKDFRILLGIGSSTIVLDRGPGLKPGRNAATKIQAARAEPNT